MIPIRLCELNVLNCLFLNGGCGYCRSELCMLKRKPNRGDFTKHLIHPVIPRKNENFHKPVSRTLAIFFSKNLWGPAW